jgi:hypothetical protein
MRKSFFEILAIALIAGSLLFFYKCVTYLERRDYVAAVLLAFVGFAVIRVGSEMARLALVQKE